MAGGNTATSTNNQTAQATPYAPTQALWDNAFSSGLDNWNRRSNGRDWEHMFQTGASIAENNARQAINGNPLGGVMDAFKKSYGDGGYNTEQRSALNALMPTMNGDFLNREDPNFERLLGRASERAATEASMAASGMGRYGSGAHQGVIARNVGDVEANARLGQYNTERDRQINAANSIFGMGQTAMGNLANAGGIWSQLYNAQQAPAMELMAMGNAPQSALQELLATASAGNPFAPMSTNNTGTESKPNNLLGQVAGGLLGGASLLKGL